MNIETIKSVYFVGAGGIGMSALVRYFLFKGKIVAGYDRTPTPLTETLIAEGEQIHYEEQHGYPLSNLIEKELDIKINNCINNLPALTRRIFCLSCFENLKYEEIAQEVNVSVNVVKYHIKSALSHLREELKDYLPLFLLIFFPFGK